MKTLIKGAYNAIKKRIFKANCIKEHQDSEEGEVSSEAGCCNSPGDCSKGKKEEKEIKIPRTKTEMSLLRSSMVSVVGNEKTKEIIMEYVRTKKNLEKIMGEE